jgi:Domain of unknown function (DUF4432)
MLRAALTTLLMSSNLAFASDEPFRKTVVGPGGGDRWVVRGREVTPDCPVDWSVSKNTYSGGRQEGVEGVELYNGQLFIHVIPTRGMGIRQVWSDDVLLRWDSPVKEIVHPKFINLQSRGGLGWLEGFNEWMCRCGLENSGQPGTDRFINNQGDESTMELPLHGKIANIPASELELLVERKPPYRLRLRGRVDERMVFGPKLELWTELWTEPGAASFHIEDTVTNRGAQPQEFQMLYHCNFGGEPPKPLLEEGSTFVGPVREITPFNAHAAAGLDGWNRYAGPMAGYVEQVYALRLFGDARDRTLVMLQNRDRDRAVSMGWSLKELPYLTVWKNTGAVEDGYVTGLEPGTSYPYNRRVERQFGRVPKLGPGESYRMALEVAIHSGREEVREVARAIQSLQGERETQVNREPPEIE